MWLIDLADEGRICAVTDGISALELKPLDLEQRPMYSVRALRVMFHPGDVAQFDSVTRRCQQDLRRVRAASFDRFLPLDSERFKLNLKFEVEVQHDPCNGC
jgi:hypothetical protein